MERIQILTAKIHGRQTLAKGKCCSCDSLQNVSISKITPKNEQNRFVYSAMWMKNLGEGLNWKYSSVGWFPLCCAYHWQCPSPKFLINMTLYHCCCTDGAKSTYSARSTTFPVWRHSKNEKSVIDRCNSKYEKQIVGWKGPWRTLDAFQMGDRLCTRHT